jgi:hypothetical protein
VVNQINSLLNDNQAALTTGCWLIHSQSAELSDITRPALPEKQSNDDPVHKQMIYFRKEKKKPVASRGLTPELLVLASAGKIKISSACR